MLCSVSAFEKRITYLIKISVSLGLLILLQGATSQDTRTHDATEPGFRVSRVSGLNMVYVQCNGSNLPSDARDIMNILLERYYSSDKETPKAVATLSSTDGVVRLESQNSNTRDRADNSISGVQERQHFKQHADQIYVGGRFDHEDAKLTYVGILLGPYGFGDQSQDANGHLVIKFGCVITYTKKNGYPDIIRHYINVNLTDFDKIQPSESARTSSSNHPVNTEDEEGLLSSSASSSSSSSTTSSRYGESMFISLYDKRTILLLTMAVLLVLLFVICVMLIIDRYTSNKRRKERRSVWKSSETNIGSCNIDTRAGIKRHWLEDRPLPSPPISWTYDQQLTEDGDPPNSSYKMRLGSDAGSIPRDIRYGSKASIHYSRPIDEIEAVT